MNSNEKVDTIELEKVDTNKKVFCKDTYEFIINSFPWVSITPTLHKLLAHIVELIRDHNEGYGLKNFSEEVWKQVTNTFVALERILPGKHLTKTTSETYCSFRRV